MTTEQLEKRKDCMLLELVGAEENGENFRAQRLRDAIEQINNVLIKAEESVNSEAYGYNR